MSKTKNVRKIKDGVYSLGRENGKTGSNVYFYTKSTMGTSGTKSTNPNHLGEIRTGRINNPNGIIAVDYALSKESYLNNNIKTKIIT